MFCHQNLVSQSRNRVKCLSQWQFLQQNIQATEIGRKCLTIQGDLQVNNFIQVPDFDVPNSIKSLGLIGRYVYIQCKSLSYSNPFTFHFDIKMRDIQKTIRISASNLYKNLSVQNDFIITVPLNLDVNRWTVVVLDLCQLLQISGILDPTYVIANNHEVKQITLTSCCLVRGIYTTDNLYDFVTLPTEMRFKFSFDISKWPENFAWHELPDDAMNNPNQAFQRSEQARAKAALKSNNKNTMLSQQDRDLMEKEISDIMAQNNNISADQGQKSKERKKKNTSFATDSQENDSAFKDRSPDKTLSIKSYKVQNTHQGLNLPEFQNGFYIGQEQNKSELLMKEPVLELKKIIGYTPSFCLNLKWSNKRIGSQTENVVLYTSGAALIAADAQTHVQKRFFFGHTEPICTFDVSKNGRLVASAQMGSKIGKFNESVIKLWDYENASCLHTLTTPLESIRCVAFSPLSNLLAVVGLEKFDRKMFKKDECIRKQILVFYDLSKLGRAEPEICARQISDFDIQFIKFSPIDNTRLVSCGKQNIRFWKLKETGNIKGTCVVLKEYSRDPEQMFTCLDFGCKKIASQNDFINHVYVSSVTGTIFQIGYESEKLEQTYRNITVPVLSISVNEHFCATGCVSAFLKIYQHDFIEELLVATHEQSPVCSVEISPDGLRVLWGTKRGDLLIYDRSNKDLSIIMQSHSNQVVSMDVHQKTGNIITASSDYTIRIWDCNKQLYEYACQQVNDQPLCIATHPQLPIFCCGFQSGVLRGFDFIEMHGRKSSEQITFANEFVEFTKPIVKVAYSPGGDLLIACCVDGSVSFHNANRDHLLIKRIYLTFPPQNLHVAFSPVTRSKKVKVIKDGLNYQQSFPDGLPADENIDASNCIELQHSIEDEFESLFGLMGEHGNNVMIYDTESFVLRNQIQAGHFVKIFQFTSSTEIIIATMDQKIKFYSLKEFGGVFQREISTVHRGSITTTSISENKQYLLTGGEDNLLKIWDYQAQKAIPYFFQSFTGHQKPIVNAFFDPINKNRIFSTAGMDGIFIWDFNGVTEVQQDMEEREEESQFVYDKDRLHDPTPLEQLRLAVQDKKKIQLGEYCFYVGDMEKMQPEKNLEYYDPDQSIHDKDEIQGFVELQKADKNLPYTHFVSIKEHMKEKDCEISEIANDNLEDKTQLRVKVLGGYDGFGGTHDNLKWLIREASIVYTMNNKIVFEKTKNKEQIFLHLSQVRLSTMAVYEDKLDQKDDTLVQTILAVADGEANSKNQAYIYIINASQNPKTVKRLSGHNKGIQSLCFFEDYLISLSVEEERCACIWNWREQSLKKMIKFEGSSGHQIVIDQKWNQDHIDDVEFFIVGGDNLLTNVVYNIYDQSVKVDTPIKPNVAQNLKNQKLDFLCGTFTTDEQKDYGGSRLLILGTNDGSLMIFNCYTTKEFIQNNKKMQIVQNSSIGCIRQETCSETVQQEGKNKKQETKTINHYLVIGAQSGEISRYLMPKDLFPSLTQETTLGLSPNDEDQGLKGGVIAMEFEKSLNEAIIGTNKGYVYYINLKDKKSLKLISRMMPTLDVPSICKFDANQKNEIFIVQSSSYSGEFKLYSSKMIDELKRFEQKGCGKVVFIERMKKKYFIGYADGAMKVYDFQNFESKEQYRFDLDHGDQLTCCSWSPNQINFAVGTQYGQVFLCSYKQLGTKNTELLSTRLTGCVREGEISAISSICLSSFDPHGYMIIAFTNGDIRSWKTKISYEVQRRIGQKKNLEILDLADFILEKVDGCNLFDERRDFFESNSKDYDSVLTHNEKCWVSFDVSQQDMHKRSDVFIYAFHSSIKCLFVRNINEQVKDGDKYREKTQRIPLKYQPTCIDVINAGKELDRYSELLTKTQKENLTLAAIGTKEGYVILQTIAVKVDQKDSNKESKNTKLIGKTQAGQIFGEVSSIAVRPDGELAMLTTIYGEIQSLDVGALLAQK